MSNNIIACFDYSKTKLFLRTLHDVFAGGFPKRSKDSIPSNEQSVSPKVSWLSTAF
jgi:hypothetical protein